MLTDPPAFAGLVPGLFVAAISLTPSLMPRSAVFQGVVSGLAAVAAYALGVSIARLSRMLRARFGRSPSETNGTTRVPNLIARSLLVAAPTVLGIMLLGRWRSWQRDVHEIVGATPPSAWAPLVVVLVAGALVLTLVVAARTLRVTGRRLGRPLQRVLPAAVATAIGVVVVLVALTMTTNRFVTEAALQAIDRSFDSANNGIPEGVEQPVTKWRSGGPGSTSPWDELGYEGRMFVGSGPEREQIAEVTGRPATDPIRVYGGLDTSEEPAELAAVVLKELIRTGAFDRAVLCVAVPTGRGWVNSEAAAALEYLYAGDTAIASMQYSYLPSPLAFLVDPHRAKESGRQLFDLVHRHWAKLPEKQRPRLVVYGESLGSTGAQAAFTGLADLRNRADAALFVGPPESNTLWRDLVARRDPGTLQTMPTYDAGSTARFASRPADLTRPTGPWGASRALFLQNPTDPIVWWSPRLIWDRPDWLREPSHESISGPMQWFPLVTFLQVSADMVVANNAPPGQGHRYGDFVDYWVALLQPRGWTAADTAKLTAAIPPPETS